MSVIIRLQNLPWSASALDIRRFFNNLSIPDGGVHIVGGEQGDAFIAFSSDEDARQAMLLQNHKLSDAPITLFLSSKSEMQNVIAIARGLAPPTPSVVAGDGRNNQSQARHGPPPPGQNPPHPGRAGGDHGGPDFQRGAPETRGYNGPPRDFPGGIPGDPRSGRDGPPPQHGYVNFDNQGSGPPRSDGRFPPHVQHPGDRSSDYHNRSGAPGVPGHNVPPQGSLGMRPGDAFQGGPPPGPNFRNDNGPSPMYGRDGPPPGHRDGPPMGHRDEPQGPRDGPPSGRRDGPPQMHRDGPPQMHRDGPPQMHRDGPPQMHRDGPPQGQRDGPPQGHRDGPPRHRDGPPHGHRDGPPQLPQGPGHRDGPPQGPGHRDGPPQGHRNGPPLGYRDGPPRPRDGPHQGHRDGPPPGHRDGPPQGHRDGPPPRLMDVSSQGLRDGPPQGHRDGPLQGHRDGLPLGHRDGPPLGPRDGPPLGPRDGPPLGLRDGPPQGPRDGPPLGPRDGPPQGHRDGPPQGHRDGPPNSFMRPGPPQLRPGWDGPPQDGPLSRGYHDEFPPPNEERRSKPPSLLGEPPRHGFRGDGPPPPYDQDYDRNNFRSGSPSRSGPPGGFRNFDTGSGPEYSGRGNHRERFEERGKPRDRDRDRRSPPLERGRSGRSDEFRRSGRDRDHGRDERRSGKGDFYVYICNMPKSVSYSEVRKFFHGAYIPWEGLKLINDTYGNRNGTGYVKFFSEQDGLAALKLNGSFMSGQQVKIEKCSTQEFEMAIDSFTKEMKRQRESRDDVSPKRSRRDSPPPRHQGPSKEQFSGGRSNSEPPVFCVGLKNLPEKVERLEVRSFFDPLRSSNIYVEYNRDGHCMGSAYVEFPFKRDFEEALTYDKKLINGNPIEVFPMARHQVKENIERNRTSQKQPRKPRDLADDSFDSIDDAVDFDKDLRSRSSRDPTTSRSQNEKSQGLPGERKCYCIKMQGLPLTATEQTVSEFFSGLAIAPRGIHMTFNNKGQSDGTAYVEFVTSTDCQDALEKDMEYLDDRYISIVPINRQDMQQELNPNQNKDSRKNEGPRSGRESGRDRFPPGPPGRGRGNYGDPGRRKSNFPDLKSIPNMGNPAAVVGASNVPFRATIQDIVDFFIGYKPVEDSIRLHYDDQGKPTGDALISFHLPEDAEQAVKDLHHTTMNGRTVNLFMLK